MEERRRRARRRRAAPARRRRAAATRRPAPSRSTRATRRRSAPAPRRSRPGTSARTCSSSGGGAGAARSTLSSSRCTASPISVAASPAPCAGIRPLAATGSHAADALGVVAVGAALEERERAVREAARPVCGGRRSDRLRAAAARELPAAAATAPPAANSESCSRRLAASPGGTSPAVVSTAKRSTRTTKPRARRRRSHRSSPASSSTSASSRPSTQPIGVARRRCRSRVDRARDDQPLDRARHRDVVEAQPLGLLLASSSASRTSLVARAPAARLPSPGRRR